MTKTQRNALRNKTRKGRSGHWISPIVRLAIYLRDAFMCQYCGADLRDAKHNEIGLDHLDPCVAHGRQGNNDPKRLVTCCRKCNSSRQDEVWYRFATGGAVERIRKQVRKALNVELASAIRRGEAAWPNG